MIKKVLMIVLVIAVASFSALSLAACNDKGSVDYEIESLSIRPSESLDASSIEQESQSEDASSSEEESSKSEELSFSEEEQESQSAEQSYSEEEQESQSAEQSYSEEEQESQSAEQSYSEEDQESQSSEESYSEEEQESQSDEQSYSEEEQESQSAEESYSEEEQESQSSEEQSSSEEEQESQSAEQPKTEYVVYFYVDGELFTEVTVTEGEGLESLPQPTAKAGHTASWDKDLTELGNITSDVEVNAVYTAKTYRVVLDLKGGTYHGNTELDEDNVVYLTYGQSYDFGEPTRMTFSLDYFNGYYLNGVKIAAKGVWTFDGDATVEASWSEATPII